MRRCLTIVGGFLGLLGGLGAWAAIGVMLFPQVFAGLGMPEVFTSSGGFDRSGQLAFVFLILGLAGAGVFSLSRKRPPPLPRRVQPPQEIAP
jgi:uncharacterized membrane protein YphA (DoxX/SURF4 family)